MYRRPIVIANWKMYLTAAEAVTLASQVNQLASQVDDLEIVLLPPLVWLPTIVGALGHRPRSLHFGLQNFYPVDEGPYTGEVSLAMVRGLASYALIGHSERRLLFGETDEVVNEKLAAALRAGVTPIVCVGELTKVALAQRGRGRPTLLERQSDIFRQLEVALQGIRSTQIDKMIVCYEPLWAIGNGQNVPAEHVETVLVALREQLNKRFGATIALRMRTVYGGSVTDETITDYLAYPHIDGVLVGGASRNRRQFETIIRAVAGATRSEG